MRGAGLAPDAASYNAALAACGKGGRWGEVRGLLSLLEDMRGAGIEPGVIAYGAVISACGEGKRWEEALSLLKDAPPLGGRDGMEIPVTTIN